jgi:hypothetical protein
VYREQLETFWLVASGRTTPKTESTDVKSAASVLATAVSVANKSGGLALLSTVSAGAQGAGVPPLSSRMIQPLPVELSATASSGDICDVVFHTTRESKKFHELSADGRCTISFLNPAGLSCVVFTGSARRMPTDEERALYVAWPLFPPMGVLYPGDTPKNFSAWTMRVSAVQVVSVPHALGGGVREDWRAPELKRDPGGAWVVVCEGGM